MNDLFNRAAELFGVPADVIRRSAHYHRGSQRVCAARNAVAYALRETHGLSLAEIGTALGGRDHTTIIHSLQVAEQRAVGDYDYALDLAALL